MITSSLLSAREKEVAELLLLGKSNKQIATTLNITVHTVEFHLSNIYRKIGVVSRSEAILALAKIQLGETTGEEEKGELGETTVEIVPKAVDNAKYPILQRVPMKRLIFYSFVLLAPALLVFLFLGGDAVVFRPDNYSDRVIPQESIGPATVKPHETSSVGVINKEMIGLATVIPYETSYPSPNDPFIRVSTGEIAQEAMGTATVSSYEAGYASPNDPDKRDSMDENSIIDDTNNQRVQNFAVGFPGWLQVNTNGFGDSKAAVSSMAVYKGQLYVGTSQTVTGGQIFRTSDGHSWTQFAASGEVATPNSPVVIEMLEYQGYLYAATGWAGQYARLWRFDGSSWQVVLSRQMDGFTSLVAYNGYLYVGGHPGFDGPGLGIWRSPSGNSGTWSQVVSGGNGEIHNAMVADFRIFQDHLLAAVVNRTDGVEIWSTTDGITWDRVVTGGKGNSLNREIGGFGEYRGMLYVSASPRYTDPYTEIWRTSDGQTWDTIVDDNDWGTGGHSLVESYFEYEGKLYGFVINQYTGMEIWRTSDGVDWQRVYHGGFGNANNYWALWNNTTIWFNGALYLAPWDSGSGGQVWEWLPKTAYLPITRR